MSITLEYMYYMYNVPTKSLLAHPAGNSYIFICMIIFMNV